MVVERLQIRIGFHVGEVIVAEQDGPRERVDRLVGLPGPGEGAGEVIEREKILGKKLGQPPIELHRAAHRPLAGDELGENPQHVHRVGPSGQQPLEEVDLEIELAERAEPVGWPPPGPSGPLRLAVRLPGGAGAICVGLGGVSAGHGESDRVLLSATRRLRRRRLVDVGVVWMIPVGIALLLLEVIVEFVVEIVETRLFVGEWLRDGKILLVPEIVIVVGIGACHEPATGVGNRSHGDDDRTRSPRHANPARDVGGRGHVGTEWRSRRNERHDQGVRELHGGLAGIPGRWGQGVGASP